MNRTNYEKLVHDGLHAIARDSYADDHDVDRLLAGVTQRLETRDGWRFADAKSTVAEEALRVTGRGRRPIWTSIEHAVRIWNGEGIAVG